MMKKENLLFIILLISVFVIRLLVFLIPNVDVLIGGVVVHHFWIGVLVLIIGFLLMGRDISVLIFGVGLGLIIDQLVFIILGGGGDLEYWSNYSMIGTVILLGIIYYFRRKFISIL